jgi:diguanylate cyclase (GGDEF)-like protein/PAS domain S-box-containing protein
MAGPLEMGGLSAAQRVKQPAVPRSWDVLSASSCPILVTDATLPDNPIIFVNAAFTALCGYSAHDALGRNCRFLQGPDTDPLTRSDIQAAVVAGISIQCEILNYRKDGTPFWNKLTIDPIRDSDGRLSGFVGIQHEAGAARLATEKKAEAESRLASIADHIPGYIYQRVLRTDGTIEVVYCSPSLQKLLGIDQDEASRTFYDHVHPDDRDALVAAIRNSAAEMSIFREEFRLVSVTGTSHWLRSDAPPRRLANGEIVWDGLAIEISTEKRWESEIANLALRDPLTGLLTRAAWRQALEVQLSSGLPDARCGVLYIDIQEFRDLNERVGQSVADEILRQTARRLIQLAGSVGGIAARMGGDEFAILFPACSDETVLLSLAQASGDALAVRMEIGAQYATIRTCMGAALYTHGQSDASERDGIASELMTQAELALRWAKQAGPSGHVLYSPELDDRFVNQTILARSLQQAIANDELEVHYQPLVDLSSGRVLSAEALVRWNHPTLGMQGPDLFISIAEKMSLIGQLGRWVIEQAMRQHMLWKSAGLVPPPIAINVSGTQLREPGFVALVEEAMRNTGANASDFEIELTEGLLIEPSPQIMASLHALRDLGFTITIDDFGSGHATFRYLRDFPVDKLKIDQIFVRKLVRESNDAQIIRAVISLARSMGIGFVAEGVETEMQRDFLQREGCQIGQGFLFSLPLVAEDFGWLLANDVRLPRRSAADVLDGGDDDDAMQPIGIHNG